MFTLRNVGKIENLEKEILRTLHYFFFFDYPPTFTEIHTFLKKKTSKKRLASILEKMEKKGVLMSFQPRIGMRGKLQLESSNYIDSRFPLQGKHGNDNNEVRYTLGEYGIRAYQISNIKDQRYNSKLKTINNLAIKQYNNWNKRYFFSLQKLNNFHLRLYIKLLSFFPQIKLVGLSGTVAMMNADEEDDIDLFIITAKNRLFTARIIALLFAHVMCIRRKRLTYLKRPSQIGYKDKVCLNLFFDESNLNVPKYKQTEYVAHEVLQMKPLVQKGDIYMRFIDANKWVFRLFPNAEKASSKFKVQSSKLQFKIQNYFKNFKLLTVIFNFSFLTFNLIGGWVESLLKKFQLSIISKHQTTEIVTNTQLWFFPEDFEKKLHGFSRITKMD